MSPPPPASTIGESVETTLASIKATSASLSATMKQSAKTAQTAEQTLADLRSTLARWDAAKKRFSDALDSAARRLCESLGEAIELPNGPPAGVTAHGWQHAERQDWSAPAMVTECSAIARPDMTMANTEIAAHEYCDSPAVLRSKVRALAEMIRSARRPVVYTGAGISTAAGVPDYATKAGSKSVACPSPDKLVEGADPFQAGAAIYCQPTYSHRAIVSLYRQGHVHEWVQQNHDGLAQRAGMPQEAVNAIHGEWFDPSNPVVPMTGSLRTDNVRRLRATTDSTDLVIAMGSSLSGVMADQIVSGVGKRALREAEQPEAAPSSVTEEGEGEEASEEAGGGEDSKRGTKPTSRTLGVVIINLQQTRLDRAASLRIWAKLDDVLAMLVKELSISVPPMAKCGEQHGRANTWAGLPYDAATGVRQDDPSLTVGLEAGMVVELKHGNAPMAPAGMSGTVLARAPHHDFYTIDFADGVQRHLGMWMLEAASRGALERLPLANPKAPVEPAAEPAASKAENAAHRTGGMAGSMVGTKVDKPTKGVDDPAIDDVLPLGPVQM